MALARWFFMSLLVMATLVTTSACSVKVTDTSGKSDQGQKLADEGNDIQRQEVQRYLDLKSGHSMDLALDSDDSINWSDYTASERTEIHGKLQTYIASALRYNEILNSGMVEMKSGRSKVFISLTLRNAQAILASLDVWMAKHP
ncbi:MAG: hypothetical protein QM773_13175 [Hyphomonadaceae bacterium]